MKRISAILLLAISGFLFANCTTIEASAKLSIDTSTAQYNIWYIEKAEFLSPSLGANFRINAMQIIKACAWNEGMQLSEQSDGQATDSIVLVFSEESYIDGFVPKYSLAATAILKKNNMEQKTVIITRESKDNMASYTKFSMLCTELFKLLNEDKTR